MGEECDAVAPLSLVEKHWGAVISKKKHRSGQQFSLVKRYRLSAQDSPKKRETSFVSYYDIRNMNDSSIEFRNVSSSKF